MFSTCSALTPRAPILDGRMEQFMQPLYTAELDAPKSTDEYSYMRETHPRATQLGKSASSKALFCADSDFRISFLPLSISSTIFD